MTQSITVNDLCSSPAGHLEILRLITPNDDDDTMVFARAKRAMSVLSLLALLTTLLGLQSS